MEKPLNLLLPDELHEYVDSRCGNGDVHATPGEFILELIRRDMEERVIAQELAQGVHEMRTGQFAEETVIDILYED